MAANKITRLKKSGHQTVLDDNRPGGLKIIKQFSPQAKKPNGPNSVNA